MLFISHYLGIATNETVLAYVPLSDDFWDGGMWPEIVGSNCRCVTRRAITFTVPGCKYNPVSEAIGVA